MIASAVELPPHLKQQLREEALRAAPRECCGLIEGCLTLSLSKGLSLIPAKAGKDEATPSEHTRVLQITALHPRANVANEADRFEIDPVGHIRLLRGLRGTGRTIVGCYHSHPNGRTEPSSRDRDNAVEPDFLWLICAIDNRQGTTSIAAFVSADHSFLAIPFANYLPTVPPISPKASQTRELIALPHRSYNGCLRAAPIV